MKKFICFLPLLAFSIGCSNLDRLLEGRTRKAVQQDAQTDVTPVASPIFYILNGKTLVDVRNEIAHVGPVDATGYHGYALTSWSVHADWSSPSGCDVSDPKITYTITMALPKWANLANVSATDAQAWHKFYNALVTHENGHVSRFTDALPGLKASIQNATCQTVDAAFKSATSAMKQNDIDYDVETKHGATQGATL